MSTESDNTAIPVWFPIVIAFGACFTSGITSFGDGVFFIICWEVAGSAGLLGSDYTLSKAVFYSSILPLASFPSLAWFARKEIPHCWPYSLFLVGLQIALTYTGVKFLTNRDPLEVAIAAACVFLPFAGFRLSEAVHAFALKRIERKAQASSASFLPLPLPSLEDGQSLPLPVKLEHDATGTVILGREQPHYQWMLALLNRFNLKEKFERVFPLISENMVPSEQVILVLVVTGAASGFIGAVVGTSSPPQLAAFTYLNLTKGAMRGVKVPATILSNLIKLILLSFNGQHLFKESEWYIYVGVLGASFLGATFGSLAREKCPKELLLFLLYVLLWLSVADFLGVTAHPTSAAAYVYISLSAALILLCTFLLFFPAQFSRAIGRLLQPKIKSAGSR